MEVFETDWLASRPVFYNEVTGKASYNIIDVIDYHTFEFHPEGLYHYLNLGYSILEQTPIKHVKFLRHSSKLTIQEHGKFTLESFADPVDSWSEKITQEKDVLELIQATVQAWEHSVQGDIVIPTSGGYDSRILNLFIQDKSRIRSFTYGISRRQEESYEAVYAKKLANILGTQWELIPLGEYHCYMDEWDKYYGISTHTHGMYHMEFYNKIKPRFIDNTPLLSGIIGDVWAGSVKIPGIFSFHDFHKMGYSHGVRVPPEVMLLKPDMEIANQFYQDNKEKLQSPIFRVIQTMRFKLILLSYLIAVPERIGFAPWSPFLDPEIALSMLTIVPERRNKRIWQKEFFKREGLNIEDMKLSVNKTNMLDLFTMWNQPLRPLSVHLLREVIEPQFVEWVNKNICISDKKWLWLTILYDKKIKWFTNCLRIPERTLEAYSAYLVLKPIENQIKKRDAIVKGTLLSL